MKPQQFRKSNASPFEHLLPNSFKIQNYTETILRMVEMDLMSKETAEETLARINTLFGDDHGIQKKETAE